MWFSTVFSSIFHGICAGSFVLNWRVSHLIQEYSMTTQSTTYGSSVLSMESYGHYSSANPQPHLLDHTRAHLWASSWLRLEHSSFSYPSPSRLCFIDLNILSLLVLLKYGKEYSHKKDLSAFSLLWVPVWFLLTVLVCCSEEEWEWDNLLSVPLLVR